MPSRIIAIVGPKGSPGCSFLASALARCLAESQLSTLLVDADAEGGGLAALLDLGPPDVIAGDPVAEPAIQIDKHLWFMELGQVATDALNGLEWTTKARQRYDAVIVDIGHSAGAMQQQLTAASDWLIWVVVPDRSGLHRADVALESQMLGAASTGLVFNRMRRGCLDGAEAALSGRHQIAVMGRIKEDPRIADRLTSGLPVHRLRGLRRTLRDLARSVHPDASYAGPTWL